MQKMINDAGFDEALLKKDLYKAHISEMLLHLNIKKLESELSFLEAHNQNFEHRLSALEMEVSKELELPELLLKFKHNIFDPMRKLSHSIAPGYTIGSEIVLPHPDKMPLLSKASSLLNLNHHIDGPP